MRPYTSLKTASRTTATTTTSNKVKITTTTTTTWMTTKLNRCITHCIFSTRLIRKSSSVKVQIHWNCPRSHLKKTKKLRLIVKWLKWNVHYGIYHQKGLTTQKHPYRPCPHSAPLRKNNETRSKTLADIYIKSLYFATPKPRVGS